MELNDDTLFNVCKLGAGKECCAFITSGVIGFECGKFDPAIFVTIRERLDEGTTNAEGEGGGKGCLWEEKE